MQSDPLAKTSTVEAKYRNGFIEKVVVWELTIRNLYRFCDDTSRAGNIEFVKACTGLPADSVDQLTATSFAKLYEAARELNFPTGPDDTAKPKSQSKRGGTDSGGTRSILRSIARACALGVEGGCRERVLDLTPSFLQEIFAAHDALESERTLGMQAVFAGAAPLASKEGASTYNKFTKSLHETINRK